MATDYNHLIAILQAGETEDHEAEVMNLGDFIAGLQQ